MHPFHQTYTHLARNLGREQDKQYGGAQQPLGVAYKLDITAS